jgi:glycosyltransferase involved in cell wall biosynthesis
MDDKISIMWIGLRGFPDVQGGVETHAENLCFELARLGCDITVLTRSPFHPNGAQENWRGIRMKRIWSPSTPGLEAMIHTMIGVLYAAVKRPDILHIQAIGPAIWTPFARALGLTVVVTHHGKDYERQKWGSFAKLVLRTGELLGMKYSNKGIAISSGIQEHIRTKYRVESALISNGVVMPEAVTSFDTLLAFDLVPKKYILMVSRFVPEKRHHDILDAFERANLAGWKLVLVGDLNASTPYVKSIADKVAGMKNVVCPGFRSGRDLAELYSHAGFFVLPSSHEGLPIAILEAMSYGLVVIASDIPANREVACGAIEYFDVGDVAKLSDMMIQFASREFEEWRRDHARKLIRANHNWPNIANQTYQLYMGLMKRQPQVQVKL